MAMVSAPAQDSSTCAICFETISDSNARKIAGMQLFCAHVFHSDCLAKWLEKSLTCPVCRAGAGRNIFDESGAGSNSRPSAHSFCRSRYHLPPVHANTEER